MKMSLRGEQTQTRQALIYQARGENERIYTLTVSTTKKKWLLCAMMEMLVNATNGDHTATYKCLESTLGIPLMFCP